MKVKIGKCSTAIVWLILTLFFCYQYILRILPNLIMPELILRFGLSATEFGAFASFYYIGYVALHIPFGVAFSRLNCKLILLFAILLTAVGLIPINYGTSWQWVIAGRLFTGAGSAAAIVGAIQMFRLLLKRHFAFALGVYVFCGLITIPWLTAPITNMLISHGMKYSLNLLILTGLILAGLMLLSFPSLIVAEKSPSIWVDAKAVLGNKKLLFTGIMAGLMLGPLEGFCDGWGSAFMQAVHKLDRVSANSLVSTIFSGTCIGYLILPYAAEKLRSYYSITLLAALVMGVAFVYLAMGLGESQTLVPLCFTIGICCGYQAVILAKMATFVPEGLSGLAGSVGNMVIMSFGPIFHQLIGFFMDRFWEGGIVDGTRVYPKSAYLKAIMPIPVAMLISIAGFSCLIILERSSKSRDRTLENV